MDRNTYLTTEEFQALLAQHQARHGRHITLPVPRLPAPDSTTLQKRMQAFAATMGGWAVFSLARSDRAKITKSGFPDDLWVGHGRHLAIEFKREKERVSLAQQEWLQAFWRNTAQVEVYVLYPSDEQAFLACLTQPAPHPRDRRWMERLPVPCQCREIA